MELKICKKCKVAQHPTEEFLYHSASGYYSRTCKTCHNKERRTKLREEKGENYDHTKAKDRKKKCDQCQELKPLNIENFPKNRKTYRNTCRECLGTKRLINIQIIEPKYYGKLRKCSDCKEEKEITSNFYYQRKTRKYSYICKPCKTQKGKKYNNSISKILIRYRNSDKKKGFTDNNLTIDYIEECLEKPCTYCELESSGLDRIDNSKGHTIENTTPCCKECNTARMDNFSPEEMFIIGKAIREVKLNRCN